MSNTKKITPVRFLDYVKKLPHEWIFANLISDAPSSRRILSSAMLADAAAEFASPKSLTKRFNELPFEHRVTCACVYLMGANGHSFDALSYAQDPMLKSLLVYAAHTETNSETLRLFAFEEFAEALRPAMAQAIIEACKTSAPKHAQDASFQRPLNDVAIVCSLAFARQLKRSVHGGLARKSIGALKKLTHDPTLTGRGIAVSESGHPAGFLIGYCLHDGLIFCDDDEYYLCEKKFFAWLKDDVKDNLQKIVSYYNEFSGGIDTQLVREIWTQKFFCKEEFCALIPEVDQEHFDRALSVFEFFGRVDISYSDASNHAEVEPRRETIVMSDFSVLIPQEATPAELFEFSKVGILLTFDKIYKGQISRESVSNALSAGVPAAFIGEWLCAHNAPANVTKTVDEWVREFSRLFVTDDAVLVSSDEKITQQIASIKPLRNHVIPVDAHTVFMIRPASVDLVYEILEKLGFDTRAPSGFHVLENVSSASNESSRKNKKQWMPLTDFAMGSDMKPKRLIERTKYGSGLKALDIGDMFHVIDYAILTSQYLVIDYAGNANIKQNIYTIKPVSIDKGINSVISAEVSSMRGRQQFYLDKIKRIAVVSAT